MSHTITSKLNNDARSHAGQSGTTFFVSVGEKNFNFKTKQNEYTNYEAALFAKDAQIPFYQKALVKGAIIEVKGSGILLELDPTGQYPPKLALQDAKLGFVNDELADKQGQQAPQGYQQPQQQAPQHPPYGQAPQQSAQQVPYGQSVPYGQPPQQAPQGYQQNPK